MAAPVNVPRWIPSPKPKSSPEHDNDDEFQEEHDISPSPRNRVPFPFSRFTSPQLPAPTQLAESQLSTTSASDFGEISSSIEFSTVNDFDVEGDSFRKYEASAVGWQSDGVFLSWEDLWVTVPVGKNGSHPILQGITGYAQAGEVLAIMGPSGSGKSTLLDALAGRLDSSTNQSGKILVNGLRQRLTFGNSAYVTQDDILMTTLTVREAVHYSALLQLPDSMSSSEKRKIADDTIKEMGLQDAMNTRIGGWGHKGISGGQKRRVGICIEILTRAKLLFLDEPTSGLDSAASYHVMKRIVDLARKDGRTVIASIHQPSTEVLELFQNLCLLSSGKTVYFGPVSAAILKERNSSNGVVAFHQTRTKQLTSFSFNMHSKFYR